MQQIFFFTIILFSFLIFAGIKEFGTHNEYRVKINGKEVQTVTYSFSLLRNSKTQLLKIFTNQGQFFVQDGEIFSSLIDGNCYAIETWGTDTFINNVHIKKANEISCHNLEI